VSRVKRLPIVAVLALVMTTAACTRYYKDVKREEYTPSSLRELTDERVQKLGKQSPFMKLHMKNGNLYVLKYWSRDEGRRWIVGDGTYYNSMRDTLWTGEFRIGVDSVAVFETNVTKGAGAGAALTVFAGITAAVTIGCIIVPKACFGSCPTFYVQERDSVRLAAEGFSASIAPSLEATDIDDLRRVAAGGDDFVLEMRNEALETHVVRHADLLAVPVTPGGRVFADPDGSFWECGAVVSPVSASGPGGDCLALLHEADGRERYSKADSTDLAARETLELEFDHVPGGPVGLVIGCRQTLMSTYLLYQTFAYMGENAGYWFAQFERKKLPLFQNPVQNMLGGIEVLVPDSTGQWIVADRIEEYGPLAVDVHLLRLGRLAGDPARIRLRMTKGDWRVDYAALAPLSREVRPIHIQPYLALRDGRVDDGALALLCDSAKALTTMPGDIYILKYHLPDVTGDYALFLESRGYYLEWMREEWMEEENPALLTEMIFNPDAALRRLAPDFKKVEGEMEDRFWSSRYARQ
jgi:hypothetical protein